MARINDELLEKLGYDTEDRANSLFKEYVEYIRDELKDTGSEETKKMLQNRYSSLYVELAHFVIEIGIDSFHNEVKRYHSKMDFNKTDVDLYTDVYGDEYFLTYQQSAYALAKYLNKQKDTEDSKPLVKVLNMN